MEYHFILKIGLGLNYKTRQLCLSHVLFILTLSCQAQPTKYFIDSIDFSIPFGNRLQKIILDPSDNIWLNSAYGSFLHRYNGKSDTVSSFPFPIDLLKLDAWGRIWEVNFLKTIPTITYFDTTSGQIFEVKLLDDNNQPLQAKGFYVLGVYPDKLYFIATSGVLYSTKLTKKLTEPLIFKAETTFASFLNISSDIVPELEVDQQNKVWLSLGPQILRYDPSTHRITDFSFFVKKDILNKRGIITTANASYTWLNIHYTGQLFRIDRNDQVKSFSIPYRIYDIEFDKFRHILWIATNNGLFFVKEGSDVLHHYPPEIWQKSGLSSPLINSLSFDKNNNLWIVSSGGVQLIRGLHHNVQRIVPELPHDSSIIDARRQTINGLAIENTETLWWFNDVHELIRYDKQTGEEQRFNIQNLNPLMFNEVKSIAFNAPYILLSSREGALLRFNTQTQQFSSPTTLDKRFNGYSIKSYNQGSRALIYLDQIINHQQKVGQKTFKQYEFQRWNPTSESMESVFCTITGHVNNEQLKFPKIINTSEFGNTLWLTLTSQPFSNIIIKASLDLSTCENFLLPFEKDRVYIISQIDPETLWLIQGNHIRQMNIETKQILYEQLLPLKTIDKVDIDKEGNFLVYGNYTLWRFNILTQIWSPLFVSEVPQDIKTGMRTAFDKDNNIFYILSHQYILAVDTSQKISFVPPKLSFTSIKVGEKTHTLFEPSAKLEITYAQAIEISYSVAPLMPSKLLSFRYRFAKDKPWTMIKNMQLLFTLLPHGDYTLEMQVTFSHQDFGESQYLHFSILPPWWHTKFAYTLYFMALLLILFFLRYWIKIKSDLREAKTNELLQQQQRLSALGLLAGGIVHDINNALFVISGSTELIAFKDKNKSFSKYLENILSVIDDTKKMTDKLLSFARKGSTSYSVINIHSLIDDAIAMVSLNIKQPPIEINTKYRASLPYIAGDSTEIKNTLVNLVLNASQAINTDQGLIQVSTINQHNTHGEVDNEGNLLPEHCIVITIKDNGYGIPKAILNQIFEPFVTTRSDSGGTGLGLSVVYGTIKQHHGNINIASKVNKGTQITLFLPTTSSDEKVVVDKTHSSISFHNKCILLCEDNKYIKMTIKEMLNNLGIRVLLASNGRECLQTFQSHAEIIDLVILDDVMPLMGGRECFYELKMHAAELSIIMITGYRTDHETDQLIKDGLLGIYKKPIAYEELVEVLGSSFS